MGDWAALKRMEGNTLRFAVLATGAEPTQFADMIGAGLWASKISCEGHSIAVEVPDFEPCVRHLAEIGFRGVIVLGAHRVEAARLGAKFFLAANSMGVANALSLQGTQIYAQNTEITAITELIKDIEPTKALVLGSGAAARSVITALFEAGWKVRLWNRSALKARPMIPLFARYGKIEQVYQPDPAECRLVVNCTPLGAKAGECPPLEWGHVRPKTTFLDLVIRRVPTDFLRNAANRGLKAIDGRHVIVESGAEALDWWTGTKVDRAPMREIQGLH